MTLTKEKRYQIVVHLESKNEYIRQFKAALDKEGSERLTLMTYLNSQFQKLDHLIEAISQETIWQVFTEIL